MKIVSASVDMTSQHMLKETDIQQESLRVWNNTKAAAVTETAAVGEGAAVSISQQAKELLAKQSTETAAEAVQADQTAQAAEEAQSPYSLSDKDKAKLRMLQALIEALTGRHMHITGLDEEEADGLAGGRLKLQVPARLGWGIDYHAMTMHSETESMSFKAAGTVKTADGKEINFSAELALSRSFVSQTDFSFKAGDALRDPLVINFGAASAQLTNEKIAFDIDADGSKDEMSFLKQGSGFLTLDLNGDGKVNDGRELFGTVSGDGFKDLAAYDQDGNQWIDENDAVYQRLQVWSKDAQGNDQLTSLSKLGIGAVYLGSASTEFALKDSQNSQHGQLRQSGIFLQENGQVGTIQHVDLVV